MKVLVVGAGPVGMTLAARLAQAQVEVVLIDKRRELSTLPRGIAVSQRTLSTFDKIGILPQVLSIGVEIPRLNLHYNTERLAVVGFSDPRLTHPYFFHAWQSGVERILASRLSELNVTVKRDVELIKLHTDSTCVSAYVEANGEHVNLCADLVVGCDGGWSRCRRLAGIRASVETYGGYFQLADVTLAGLNLASNETHYFLNRDGYLMLVPAPGGATRVIASYRERVKEAVLPTARDIEAIIALRSGQRADVNTLIWSTQAPFSHRVANRVRMGSVLLAGDALHQFSPIGGTNMNVGIADADALADAILTGNLDHYEQDRLTIIHQQIAITRYLTRVMVRPSGMPMPTRPFVSRSLRDLVEHELPASLAGFHAGELGAQPNDVISIARPPYTSSATRAQREAETAHYEVQP